MVLLGTSNPRRGSWTSARRPVRALRDSEPAVWPQPCEGDPLAKAGSTGEHWTGVFVKRKVVLPQLS